ncbi:hypothetical protein BJF78_10310 [Pseudonocardia sp. CNS-139]|nr:hypothetical protein BJF78_10310 [Pseudonocardia sp. CNS-139]
MVVRLALGTWAMAPSTLDETRTRDRAPEPADARTDESDELPRRAARHRYADEPAPVDELDDGADLLDEDEDDGPRADLEPDPDPDGNSLGLRPESVARLSDADRQLLARLQAELLEGRRPRVTRRAGIGNSFGPAANGVNGVNGVNGSGAHGNNGSGTNGHRTDPPDLAG